MSVEADEKIRIDERTNNQSLHDRAVTIHHGMPAKRLHRARHNDHHN